MEIGTAAAGSFGNNCASLQQINGALTNWSHMFDCYNTSWEGNYTNATNLYFKISYDLVANDLFYTTTVSVTNLTSAMIPELYY